MIRGARRAGWVVTSILVLLVALAGCSGGQPVTRSSTAPGTPTTTPVQPDGDPSALAAQKAAAKIEDCPSTTATEPVDGGLPPLTLGCLGGGRPVQLAGLRGTPMVINIWAQWCGPCRTEAPYLAEVSGQTDGRVAFVGIDFIDRYPGLAIAFADEAGWRYPQLVDPDGVIQVPLKVQGPPRTIFMRADGTIAYVHSGPFTSSDQLRELVTTHLGVSA